MSHPIPSAALDDRLAFVGNAGSGKTYSSGTAVERLLNGEARVVIPDPLGVWWGLALAQDGKKPSIFREQEKLVIFGGPRGDLPLTEHAGALIGETIAGMRESCILDLSEFKSAASERRFMLAFLDALYRKKTHDPLHVIFDEADMWSPQRVLDKEGDANKLLGMMETICRRGRAKGFIPWLISQRPAVINKNVLSQIDGMVAFKLTSVQDRDAIGDWVEGQADPAQWKAMWGDMATLETGRGVVWLPARGILKTAQFPEKATFDSSKAPKRGEKVKSAASLKPVNLDALKQRLASVEAETKQSDPRKLRAALIEKDRRIAQLEAGAAKSAPAAAKTAPDKDAIDAAQQKGFEQAERKLKKAMERAANKAVVERLESLESVFAPIARALKEAIDGARKEKIEIEKPEFQPAAPIRTLPRAVPSVVPRTPAVAKLVAPSGDGSFTRPQMKALESLAMWRALGHQNPTREMVAAIAGYSPSSGGFNNLLGGLKNAGAIDYPQPGFVTLLVDGIGVMSEIEGAGVLVGKLTNPQRKIVGALVGKGARTREEVAADTDYSASSGGFNNLLGSLRSLGLIDYPQPGAVMMADWADALLVGHPMLAAA